MTELATVTARGQRRLVVRRAIAGVGMIGVVAAITASTTLLGHDRPGKAATAAAPPVLTTTTPITLTGPTGPVPVGPGWAPLPITPTSSSEVIPSHGGVPARDVRYCAYPPIRNPPRVRRRSRPGTRWCRRSPAR